MTAFDYDLSPILLLSNLSEHTTNVINNSSVSLMVCEEKNLYNFFPKFNNKFPNIDYEDPMSRPRVTLIGNLKKSSDKNHRTPRGFRVSGDQFAQSQSCYHVDPRSSPTD